MAAARLKAPVPKGSHAITRAWERYGLRLTGMDLVAMAESIQENHGKLLRHAGAGRTEWLLEFKRQMLRVVIDPSFYYIVTVLPAFYTPPVRKGRRKVYVNKVERWYAA